VLGSRNRVCIFYPLSQQARKETVLAELCLPKKLVSPAWGGSKVLQYMYIDWCCFYQPPNYMGGGVGPKLALRELSSITSAAGVADAGRREGCGGV